MTVKRYKLDTKTAQKLSKVKHFAFVDVSGSDIWVEFPQKPPQDVIQKLKRQGFRWNPREKRWEHTVVVEGESKKVGSFLDALETISKRQRKAEERARRKARRLCNELAAHGVVKFFRYGSGEILLYDKTSKKRAKSQKKKVTLAEVKAAHRKRSKRARTQDERKRAKSVLPPEKYHLWLGHPGRYDVEGVDTPKKGRK